MSRSGEWSQTQVIEEAKKIEEAAKHGDSSQAFREEDNRISRSSIDPEVRRANAAAVTAQLERDGYLPVCGFDLAAAANAKYQAPKCGDTMGRVFNILTNSPTESIERAIYSREQHASNLQFGDIRPSLPKEQTVVAPKENEAKNDSMKKLADDMRKLSEDNQKLRDALDELKSGKKHSDTTRDGNANGSKDKTTDKHDLKKDGSKPHSDLPHLKHPERDKHERTHKQEIEKQVAEAKKGEQTVSKAVLKEVVAKLDLSVATQKMDRTFGVNQPEVKSNVSFITKPDGSIHIAGEPYGTIDLDPKTNFKVEKDGSVLATDSKGTNYHFFSNPERHAMMLLETTDKDNKVLRNFAPNPQKLISETITPNLDGGRTSFKQYNTREETVEERMQGLRANATTTHRDDWLTSSTVVYDKNKHRQTETNEFGKSRTESGDTKKVKEVFHFDQGKIPEKGLYAEHIYDNGYKYSEYGSGQTYIQRRVVSQDVDPIKFQHQSDQNGNGSIKYQGRDWALSNKQIRPDVRIHRSQRDLPESYMTWSDEGELKP